MAQGSGQVWLGTVPGIVQSWSDGAVVALVAAGSATGSARVLQNGVMSNAVPFTVDALQITSLSPASGAPGTSVTISGSGFGSAQGSGIVLLGSAAGQVTGWSDSVVVATVASTAVSGVARVEQNGLWSNALTFTVPASGGNSVTLSPNLITMLVGDTHTIQALNSSGQPVTRARRDRTLIRAPVKLIAPPRAVPLWAAGPPASLAHAGGGPIRPSLARIDVRIPDNLSAMTRKTGYYPLHFVQPAPRIHSHYCHKCSELRNLEMMACA
jgi:hypothetical protein